MVGHTHQDFLPRSIFGESLPEIDAQIDLSDMKDFREPHELFDFPKCYFRKVNASFMDEHIDDIGDWKQFINSIVGIDRLYIINDRNVSNPIMSAYANELNRRYLSQLSADGIHAIVVPAE